MDFNFNPEKWFQNIGSSFSRDYGSWGPDTDPGRPCVPLSQDEIDFNKEFMASMVGNIGKAPPESSIGRQRFGSSISRPLEAPLVTPKVTEYAPNPGWSLVKPLRKINWYS